MPAKAPAAATQPVKEKAAITIACPSTACGAKFKIDRSLIGKKARCRKCGERFCIEYPDDGSVAFKVKHPPRDRAPTSTVREVRRGRASTPAEGTALLGAALLADEDMVEFAEAVARVKKAACAAIGVSIRQGAEPRAALTSTGISLLYTISRVDGSFRHGFSLRSQWNPISTAAGRVLCVAVAALLGRSVRGMAVEPDESGMYYVEFDLDAQAQAEFAAHVVTPPLVEAASFRERCVELADELRLSMPRPEPHAHGATPRSDGQMAMPCVCHMCVHCGVEMESPAATKKSVATCPSCTRQNSVPVVPDGLLQSTRSRPGRAPLIMFDSFPKEPQHPKERLIVLMESCQRKVSEEVLARFKGQVQAARNRYSNVVTRSVWFVWLLDTSAPRDEVKMVTRKLWKAETADASLVGHVQAMIAAEQARADAGFPDLVLFLSDRTPPCGTTTFVVRLVKELFPGHLGFRLDAQVQVVGESFKDQVCVATRAQATAAQSGFELDLDRLTYRTLTTADGVNTTVISIYRKK